MRNGNRLQVYAVVILTGLLIGFANVSHAMPASPRFHDQQQPDGTVIKVRQWGDERSHGWQTEAGYTVVFDDSLKGWAYAVLDEQGRLASSSVLVDGKVSPPSGVTPSLRPLKASTFSEMKKVQSVVAAPEAAPVVGTKSVPVIMVQFSDKNFTASKAQFDNLLFGTTGTTMRNYFLENSYNQLTVSGGASGVFGPVTATYTHDYYGTNNVNGDDLHPGTLVYEAVSKAAAAGYKFAPFVDQTKSCYVDVVVIAHQGTGEEASSNGNASDIWSHKWSLNGAQFNGQSAYGEYVTNEPCSYPGGGGYIKVNTYVIQPELSDQNGTLVGVGVYAHEFSHALGLPDLYDTDYSSGGAGYWTLMAGGSWLGPNGTGDMPGHLDAWSKYFLGWINPAVVSSPLMDQSIGAASTATPGFFRLGTGTPTSGEYFLVENRQKIGYDSYLPGAGLLVWHVDGNYVSSHLSTNSVNDAECTSTAPGACLTNHYGVALVQADNLRDLERNIDGGYAGDPFVFPKTLTDVTAPNSSLWSGAQSNVSITAVSAPATVMTATMSSVLFPNFALAISPEQIWAPQGSTVSTSVTTSVSGGFSNAVSLSVTGLPAGVTAVFSPASISAPGAGSSTLMFTTTTATPAGSYAVTVTGVGGGVTQTTTVTLTVMVGSSTILFSDGLETGTGWMYTRSTSAAWGLTNAGFDPTATPHGGSSMAIFNSFDASSGDWSRLYRSSGFAIPANANTVSLRFWMYHDMAYSTSADKVQAQVSTDGINFNFVGTPVYRYGTTGWSQVSVDLSDYKGQANVQLGFFGTSGFGNNIFIDDVSVSATVIPSYKLAVQIGGAGSGSVNSTLPASPTINCTSGTCSAVFTSGTTVNLSATPSWKSLPGVFTGGCTGTGSCSVTMTGPKNITATFPPNSQVRLTPGGSPSGYGSIQDAYNAATVNATIDAQNNSFLESLNFGRGLAIILNGGRDNTYSGYTGYSTVKGLTVRSGAVRVRNIVIR